MKKVELLNLKGEKVKDINLNEEIFGITPNKAVLNDAVILTMASLRQGTHKTKNRSEVSGGGRKVEEESHGDKKELDVHVKVQLELYNG